MEVGPGLWPLAPTKPKKNPKRNSRTCHLAVAIDGDHSAHLRGATLLRCAMSVLSVMQMGREDPWQVNVAMTWL